MPWAWFGLALIGWLIFGAAAIAATGSLEELWSWLRGQSLIVQGLVWLLLLPWMAALAIWESSWTFWLRITVILGVAWVNLYMFFPKAT